MLNIVCIKKGSEFGPDYVNILFDMVSRNLKAGTEGKFWCVTDDPDGLDDGIEVIELPLDFSGALDILFSSYFFPFGQRVVYLDLALVVTGPIDELISYDGDYGSLQDSRVMSWISGMSYENFYEPFPTLYQDMFAYFDSKEQDFPSKATKIVLFDGEIKPHNCECEWIKNVWRKGGGTAAELEMICNVEDTALHQNIRSACKRDMPWLQMKAPHEGNAVIVGGGPSLKDTIEEVRWRAYEGQHIFALNNVYQYLIENCIRPDAQVVLDARAENAKFVPEVSTAIHYIASQCHPDVFDKACFMPFKVLWHCATSVLKSAIKNPWNKPECFISGGSTVGLSAMCIAYALGYRKIHLYGFDSSFSQDQHHAYSQSSNDADTVLDVFCQGRPFKCAPWMVAQAEQFQELAKKLTDDDCIITVAGDGLLPWIAKKMQVLSSPQPPTNEATL